MKFKGMREGFLCFIDSCSSGTKQTTRKSGKKRKSDPTFDADVEVMIHDLSFV